jgi:hypothetical protein
MVHSPTGSYIGRISSFKQSYPVAPISHTSFSMQCDPVPSFAEPSLSCNVIRSLPFTHLGILTHRDIPTCQRTLWSDRQRTLTAEPSSLRICLSCSMNQRHSPNKEEDIQQSDKRSSTHPLSALSLRYTGRIRHRAVRQSVGDVAYKLVRRPRTKLSGYRLSSQLIVSA